MSSDLEKYRPLYFAEAQEQLTAISQSLSRLADALDAPTEVDTAFRAAHTLKAMSATMGYGEITRAAHALEDHLARQRRATAAPTALDLRLLRNAADEIAVRLQRAETEDALSASKPASSDVSGLASPLSATVRVRQPDLNLLLELSAELAVSSNHLERTALEAQDPLADAAVRSHRELVRTLRQLTWQLNMAPLGPVFERYARIVAELGRQQNKTVRVVSERGDVELCHAMLDALNEPLLHLLRNAVAHGIEPPAERTWSGKPAAGTVTLRARRAADRVMIEVEDDGRGMDAGAIVQAAFARGLITRDQRAALKPRDALRLILLPNFTMAHTVTASAGRGMGMSVVQERLDAVGGRIEISSELGRGSLFTLDVPRLVGLLEVELVRVGPRFYAIPTTRVASAQVWLPGDIANRLKTHAGPAPEWRVLDAASLRPVPRGQLSAPSGVSLVELLDPPSVALRVDQLLGKALLNYPFAVQAAPIPILDPSTVVS